MVTDDIIIYDTDKRDKESEDCGRIAIMSLFIQYKMRRGETR